MIEFKKTQEQASGSLPWLESAVENDVVSHNDTCLLLAVTEGKKRNGYLLKTELFQVFVFKSSEWITDLISVLDDWIGTENGNRIFLQVDVDDPDGFTVLIDESNRGAWIKTKKMGGRSCFTISVVQQTSRKKIKKSTQSTGDE